MAVHKIGLGGAILLVLVAVLLLFVIGPFGLLVLILAVGLFWYAFGPGSRGSVTITTP
jgi:cbb3-type cytochrome oxidase subunit 3